MSRALAIFILWNLNIYVTIAFTPSPWVRMDSSIRFTSTTLYDNNRKNSDPLGLNGEQFNFDDDAPKLGIDVGKFLEPLSETEAAELKAAATDIINKSIAEGIDEIEKLRERMSKEINTQRDRMRLESDWRAREATAQLLNRIDNLTNDFMIETQASRQSTKLAAAADRNMEGKGLEVGVWGSLGGADVVTGSSLIGSVQAAQQGATAPVTKSENRILIVADESSDQYAKQLMDPLSKRLRNLLPEGLDISIYKPTSTLPLGGENAAAVILFLTSLSDKSAVANALDRLLRKTLTASSSVGSPPTQIVAISTLGTERFGKMPYSMQNLMGGGKLEKRRQMEETLIKSLRDRDDALDFTICKLGELKICTSEFEMKPGDCLDGSLDAETAAVVVSQAMALQPAARNATLSCVGKLGDLSDQERLDDAFLCLDGPEVMREELVADPDANYAQLVEFMQEWARLLAETGKGLTTPIRVDIPEPRLNPASGITRQNRVQLLFLPTNTGKYYTSKDDEAQREQAGQKGSGSIQRNALKAKEGGIEVLVEVTTDARLRVRAKRCNYADDAVLKEMTEETILKRLRDSIEVWKKNELK